MGNTFDKNFIDYINVRPGYPKSVFQNFSKYCQLTESSHCLEIGAGPGIATRIISSLWKPQITAIEPGEALFNFAQKKLNKFRNIEFIHTTFEEYLSQLRFECIYAATAFHWIEPALKFSKSCELLEDKGILFLFWNYFDFKDDNVGCHIQEIYKKYHPQEYKETEPKVLIRKKIENRKSEIEESCYFNHLNHFEVINPVQFTAEQYIKLLKTFPNNSYPEILIKPFYNAIEEYIKRNGNIIELHILVCSEIAGKK